jgi:hypothetical protein
LIQIESRTRAQDFNDPEPTTRSAGMAWYNLFTTDYGLMSLAVIVFVIAIGVYFAKKFNDLSKQKPGEEKDW